MNLKSLTFLVALVSILSLSSCDSEDLAAPVISGLEVGMSNSLVGIVGDELHIEAEIVAEGKIDQILIEIHKEDGSGGEIEATFTDYAGLKNTTFHDHVMIPNGTATGEYHFDLTVIDQEGKSSSVEADISIQN